MAEYTFNKNLPGGNPIYVTKRDEPMGPGGQPSPDDTPYWFFSPENQGNRNLLGHNSPLRSTDSLAVLECASAGARIGADVAGARGCDRGMVH